MLSRATKGDELAPTCDQPTNQALFRDVRGFHSLVKLPLAQTKGLIASNARIKIVRCPVEILHMYIWK
jgi:hypothetical protein